MASSKDKAWTYRVENIPYGTTVEQLIKRHFSSEDQNHLLVKSIFPSVDAIEGEEENFELTATVLFKPPTPRPDGLCVPESSDITVSKQFQGFTPLYVPPAGTKIDAEYVVLSHPPWTPCKRVQFADEDELSIVAITGLAGHAYGSWAWSEERMWLRDDLKKDIPNARILTYGYDSEVKNSTSFGIIKDHADNFLEDLLAMRDYGKCEIRPIIFIGHSLGCLIIKKVMIEAGEKGIHGARLPVRAIVFLAAPHRGLDVQALQSLVKQTPSEQLVEELKRNSPTLRDLNSRFARFGDEIDILTCYEMKQTKTVIKTEDGSWVRKGSYVTMVDQESATLSYRREKAKGVAEDHSRIAKIRRTQGGIYPNIRSAIKRALRPTVTVADEHQTSSQRAQEMTHGQAAVPWASLYHHGEPYSQAHPTQHHGEAGGLHVIGTPYRPTTPSQLWPQHPGDVPPQISHRLWTATLAPRSMSDGTLVSLEPPQDFLAGHYSRSSTPQPPTRSQSQPEPLVVPMLKPELKLDMRAESVSEQELESNFGAEFQTEPEMKVVMPLQEPSAPSTEATVQPRGEIEPKQDFKPHSEYLKAISDPDARPGSEELDRELVGEPSPELKSPRTEAKPEKTEASAESRESSFEAALSENAGTTCYTRPSRPTALAQSNDDTQKEEKEVAVTQDSLVASCIKCSMPIPNSEPHYLYHPLGDNHASCDRESHLAGETSWCCHDCAFEAQFKCPMHRSEMEPMIIIPGPYSKRTIPHISELVSASDNSILAAIKQNDIGLLQLLTANASLLLSRNSTGQTPLHLAAQLGREDCARILLSAEPNIKTQPRDVHGKTPLMMAVEYENLSVAKALLENRLDVDAVNKQGSALSRAVTYGLADFVVELIKGNVKIENPDYDGTPLLYVAARNGDERTVGALLATSDIDVDAKDSSDGNLPLFAASAKGHERILQMLLDKKADVHAVNKKGQTALHWACLHGYTEAARILLVAGADSDIKLQDSDGDTPLHMSLHPNNLDEFEIARELVSHHKADPNVENQKNLTPSHLAIMADPDDLFQLLLDMGADFSAANSNGNTILHIASFHGRWKFCRTLLSVRLNAELEVKNHDGVTPLLMALRSNDANTKVVDVLLEAGADVNTTNKYGTNPLHVACFKGFLEICRALVSRNADLKAKGEGKKNPLHWAVLNNQLDVVKFLLDCDQAPEVDEVAEDGYTSLHYAAKNGYPQICAALLDHKASMTLIAGLWHTPVMVAAWCGQIDCLKVFIEHNADLNYEYRGSNAIWKAAHSGQVETVKFLLENGASGFPPSKLNGKWKQMTFDIDVGGETKSHILRILREAKHK